MTVSHYKTTKTEGKKPKIAGIYARVSSGKQVQGFSLDQQIELCRQRCKQNGRKVRFIFREDGISAATTDRPKFNAMMKSARQQKIDIVVTWKLDRLFRSLIDAANIEKKLGEWNVSICSITEAIDTTTSNGRFVFRTLASASEWERDMIAERSRMGMQALALKHQWPNRIIPLGYDKNQNGYLVINKDEAEIVRKIFRMYLKIKSMPQVAFKLNKKGIRTKKGKKWTKAYIKRILDNQLYIGHYEIAGVKAKIKEYQIITEKTFTKAKVLRNRYRKANEPMPQGRKEAIVKRVFNEYLSFLDDVEKSKEPLP